MAVGQPSPGRPAPCLSTGRQFARAILSDARAGGPRRAPRQPEAPLPRRAAAVAGRGCIMPGPAAPPLRGGRRPVGPRSGEGPHIEEGGNVMAGPLRGIRVIEPCRFISGPLAGMLLGDLGAEVVKIEHPEGGDPFRGRPTARHPFAPIFGAYNRNKQSVTLDLNTPQGRDVYLALAERADVVLENFRPGVADRMGIGWERLRERNPRLVYCTITGFGPSGPYVQRPSYDTIASGLSGLLSQLFDPADAIANGPAFSDAISALYAVQGVLAALVGRSLDGRGQRVDGSMLGSMIAF